MTYDDIFLKEKKENKFLVWFLASMTVILFSLTAYNKSTPYVLLVFTLIVIFSIIMKQLSRSRHVVFHDLKDTFYLVENEKLNQWNSFLNLRKERLNRVKERNSGYPYLTIQNLLEDFNKQHKWRTV